MPYEIARLRPGRTGGQKKAAACKIAEGTIHTLGTSGAFISAASEEISREGSGKSMYKPDIEEKERLPLKKPGYTA